MARDRDRADDRNAFDPGEGRRIARAPEPRPAAEAERKSVLLTRHRAQGPTPSSPGGEAPAAVDQDQWDAGTAGWDEAPPWPPEPPPIEAPDFGDDARGFDFELPEPEPMPEPEPEPEPVRSPRRQEPPVSDGGRRRSGEPAAEMTRRAPAAGRVQPVQALNPVVPPQSVAGRALMLVVGIMCFLACLAVGALVLVEEAARDWQLDVSREVTVQVKPVDGKPIEPMLQTAMDLARATSGVRNIRLMSERDSEALLEPWLGSGFDYSKLPIPRLILMDLADPAGADLKGLDAQLRATLPNAELDDHSIWSKRLRTMAGTMVAASVVVLILVLTAMVLSVVFATRAAMAGNRDVVQVLHFVGAEDAFIAGEFQHHFLILGFKGGVGGGIAAMLAFLIANWVTEGAQGMPGSDQAHALFGGFAVGLNGYLGAAGIVLLVAGLTALTSRLTVRSYLNQLD